MPRLLMIAVIGAVVAGAAGAAEIPRYQPQYGLDYSGNASRVPGTASPSSNSWTPSAAAPSYTPPRDNTLGGGDYNYPQTPTLGDSRKYRNSDPSTCTSLLCD